VVPVKSRATWLLGAYRPPPELTVPAVTFKVVGVMSNAVVTATLALDRAPVLVPIAMFWAAVMVPAPEKPPGMVTLPAVDSILASVLLVAMPAFGLVLRKPMSPTALRSRPAPVATF